MQGGNNPFVPFGWPWRNLFANEMNHLFFDFRCDSHDAIFFIAVPANVNAAPDQQFAVGAIVSEKRARDGWQGTPAVYHWCLGGRQAVQSTDSFYHESSRSGSFKVRPSLSTLCRCKQILQNDDASLVVPASI